MANYYDFDFCINNSKYRALTKPDEPQYIKRQIISMNNYVQQLKEQNPNLTLDELNKILEKDYYEILDSIFTNGYILDFSMSYASAIYLSTKKDLFYKLVEEYKEKPESAPEKYSTDFNKNLRYFIKELINSYNSFMDSEQFQSPDLIKLRNLLQDESVSNNEKQKLCNSISSNLSFKVKNQFKKFTDCARFGEFGFLKYKMQDLESDLQETLISSISSVATQLEKLGFLKNYPTTQEIALSNKLGLSDFAHSLDKSKNDVGLLSLSNPNFLAGKSLDTLLALNNFWFNRFIKECDTYFEGIYSIRQLDLLPKMLNGTFNPSEVSRADLNFIFFKMNFFYKPTESFWSSITSLDEDKIRGKKSIKGKDYFFFSHYSLNQRMMSNGGDKYKEFFDSMLPSTSTKNDLQKDLDLYWNLFTPIMNGYSFKDLLMLSTIALTQGLNLSHNYGIVLNQKYFDAQNKDTTSLAFWIDFKGLNFPLRLHIPSKTLREFLHDYNGNGVIPIYADEKAFSGIPSNVLLPFSKKQVSFLKGQKANNYLEFADKPDTIEFLKHSNYLLHPKSFKDSDKVFFNLDTNKSYRYGQEIVESTAAIEDSTHSRFYRPIETLDKEINTQRYNNSDTDRDDFSL